VTQPRHRFRDRLVAEAVRLEEDRLGRILDDPAAEARAREAGGDFEHRILYRAGHLALGRRMESALEGLTQIRAWLLFATLLLAFLAGVGAAGAVFGRESTVNILVALSALLGLQLLMLLFWFLLFLYRPGQGRNQGGMLGRAALASLHWLGRRFAHRPESARVLSASVGLMRRQGLGRWVASSLTHGLWALFSLGALLASLFALSVRQYDFVWGTTLLSEQTFVLILGVLSAPMQELGWPVPDAALVSASRIGMTGGVGREVWSSFLVSAVLLYGLLPRTVLALLSLVLARRAAGKLRLDTGLPGYARLSDRLDSPSRSMGVLDPRPRDQQGVSAGYRRQRPHPVAGDVLLIGLELERDIHHWPPRLGGVEWTTLGRADERTQRQDVISALRARSEAPGVVLVVCSLARTPDRGAERFLSLVRESTDAPVWAVLDEGTRLEARGGDRALRVRQWEATVSRAGLAYALEVDLENPDHPGSRELVGLVGQDRARA
jgi:hypothetical protein